jgi:polysaccharide deacetylase family protein (PEP-CTERM system associated)
MEQGIAVLASSSLGDIRGHASVPASILLSIDVEDRQQLLERRVGRMDWNKPTQTFRRQMTAALDLLDELGCRATHFMLGVTAEHHPDLVQRAVARGDEIACHGYAHRRVYRQTRKEFELELVRAVELLEQMTGTRPRGFRAPWFSVNRESMWMYDVLTDLGFTYDASLNDTPRVPKRLKSIPSCPVRLRLDSGRSIHVVPATCLNLPLRGRIPAGGGGYWRALPTSWVKNAVEQSIASFGLASLYLHPYEFDPVTLDAIKPSRFGLHLWPSMKAVWDNFRRAEVMATLRAVAQSHTTTSYEEGLAEFARTRSLRTVELSRKGVFNTLSV